MVLHGFDQHRSCGTAGEGFDQCRGQCIHKPRIQAEGLDQPPDAVKRNIERTRGSKHANRTEHRHQVGQQVFGNVKTLSGALNEGLVYRHFFPPANDQEQHDE